MHQAQQLGEKRRYPEVLFPNEFISRNPWDDPANQTASFPNDPLLLSLSSATIPIEKLVHITHPLEADGIKRDGHLSCTFIPKMKNGKYDKDKIGHGETYKCTGDDTYEKISNAHSVFPGYLSWWGIDVRDWYREEDCELFKRVSKFSQNVYVAGYLAATPQSRYGNVAFSIKLPDILKDYQKARESDQMVCLKVGGTLRYQNEICYVVIVCLKDDVALTDMPNIAGPKFESNGLVDGNGLVINYDKTPKFNAANIITSDYNERPPVFYGWEQLVFAFYFLEEKSLKSKKVTKTTEYPHITKGSKQFCPICNDRKE